jgi:hypothetical protein
MCIVWGLGALIFCSPSLQITRPCCRQVSALLTTPPSIEWRLLLKYLLILSYRIAFPSQEKSGVLVMTSINYILPSARPHKWIFPLVPTLLSFSRRILWPSTGPHANHVHTRSFPCGPHPSHPRLLRWLTSSLDYSLCIAALSSDSQP